MQSLCLLVLAPALLTACGFGTHHLLIGLDFIMFIPQNFGAKIRLLAVYAHNCYCKLIEERCWPCMQNCWRQNGNSGGWGPG